MDTRIKISVLLVGLGILLVLLPFNSSESFQLKPDELLSRAVSEESYLSVDQVARFLNNEDSTVNEKGASKKGKKQSFAVGNFR